MVLRWFIFRTLFIAILVTLLGFGMVEYILAVLSELNYNLAGDYQAKEAISFITLTTPGRIYQVFPFICLIGALFALGQLADHRELVAIESFALSKSKIIQMSLTAPLVWILLAFLVGEAVVPKLDQIAFENRGSSAANGSRYGVWHKDQEKFYFFNSVDSNGDVQSGIALHKPPGPDRTVISDKFSELTFDRSMGWQFKFVESTVISPEKGIDSSQHHEVSWETELDPALLWLRSSEDAKLNVVKLWKYSNYLELQNIKNNQFALKLWQRVMMPPLTIGMILLAATFIFGPLRESSTGARIFSGLMVAIVFNLLQTIITPLSETLDLQPFTAALVPVVIVFGLSFILQRP